MSKVEVAIWHPTMTAEEIERRVNRNARISFSVGSTRKRGVGTHEETYCRFDLGMLKALKDADDLGVFEPFRSLVSTEEFSVVGASWIAYFTVDSGEAEIYLGRYAVARLSQMGFGVVFRAP